MLVKCTAQTCIHYRNGMCTSESIEMIDFEYYLTIENKKREISDDEMKCSTYKSIYTASWKFILFIWYLKQKETFLFL